MGTGDLLDLLTAADTKECRDCGQVKPVGEFYRDGRTKGGRKSYCKACARRRECARRERNRSRGAADYPAGKLCGRCGQWGVVVLGKDGKPSTRAGDRK